MLPLASVAPSTPPGLAPLVECALAPDRAMGTGSISELRAGLRAFVRGDVDLPQIRFPAGRHVVCQGQPGRSAWIICSGRCAVQQVVDGETHQLRELGPREVFGELSLLTGRPATASVITLEPCELMEVTANEFQRELGSMRPWMRSVVRLLARRFCENERV